jgi:TrmH family RNA methyltransferase
LEQTFLVEGEKSVLEVIDSDFEITEIIATSKFRSLHGHLLESLSVLESEDLSAIGSLKSNDAAIALVRMKPEQPFAVTSGLTLLSDGINDPGNFGTILRVADWYGINRICASPDTCELYNPKVISSSKGSFTRVEVSYAELDTVIATAGLPVYAADMSGRNVHSFKFPEDCLLVMGNESHGISASLESLITERLTIPSFGGAESLNVGVATAIMLDNYRRQFR